MLVLCTHRDSDDPPADDATVRPAWVIPLASPLAKVFVAEIENMITESCTITLVPNITREATPCALIENVATHAAHRRRGLEQAVLAAAPAAAWAADSCKAMLATGTRNPETLRSYGRAGFRRGGKAFFEARHSSA
jgi:GNAT superfamily N-acetyltransferase